ncbi:MAG: type 4a pilus biogenesis protein PilO [Planctomycetota bacterium]|nr:type 4a pilus biogenesis protein PilO [Planctomycetota bacterium]MDG1983582.1 type 4a pilus biogenesis protein PilO [Planctomycetota bacterium]
MNDKQFWSVFGGLTAALAGLFGYLIYSEHQSVDAAEAEVASLRDRISNSRAIVRKTPEVEQEVIILREISDRIREILPDTKDLNNVIRDFQEYMQEAEVTSQGFKPTSNSSSRQRTRSAFERVSYQWELVGNTFQFLEFLNRIETHSRFMAVSKFDIRAANRRALLDEGLASHRIVLDVETYKYVPPSAKEGEVEIRSYERKRDLLSGEIGLRRQALSLQTYRYQGARGRRDPLIDPRVPARVDDPNAWTVQRQQEEVDELVARVEEAQGYWAASNVAKSVLERMVQRSELEKLILRLGEDLRRIEDEGHVTYRPAQTRIDTLVADPLDVLRLALDKSKAIEGPSITALQSVGDTMVGYIEALEYEQALDSFDAIEDSLALLLDDPEREELADWLRLLCEEATILRDFSAIDFKVGGVAIIEGLQPVIIIDGKRRTVGDLVAEELVVHSVRPNEVDFIFRGAIVTREF